MPKKLLFLIGYLMVITSACNYSFSTANITDTTLAYDAAGENPTTIFSPDDTFYFVVGLTNAPDDTTLKATWATVNEAGSAILIDEVEITSGSGTLTFDLSSDQPWPSGRYRIDLFVNDEMARTLEFGVEE